MLLEVKGVTVCYDTAMVLREASLAVDTAELVSLVGPNGAGKTTLLRAIAGLVKWEIDTLKGTRLSRIIFQGCITFDGDRIEKLPAYKIAQKGLLLCPERGKLFREMTATENLMAGGYMCKDKKEVRRNLEEVYQLFPVLRERGNQVSGTLSGGEQTMLSIGRALMFSPKLLLVDEPSTGLAPMLKDDLFQRISRIYHLGVTMLLVEQDISFAFDLASRNYVMSRGTIVTEGTSQELLADDIIRKTYLGL